MTKKINVLIILQIGSLIDPKSNTKINSADIVLIRRKTGYQIKKNNLGIPLNKSREEIDNEFKNKEKYIVKKWESSRY
jgi:hypothetical protein